MTVEVLQQLVRIPSVNPDGTPGVERAGEQAVAEFLAGFLRESGAEAELRNVLEGRPNVVGRFPSDNEGKPKLLFAPHTDTVSVVGMTIDPFGAEIRDEKVWGRGASDTKGPMAAMLTALRQSRDIIPFLPYEIWFAGLMGEEAGQHGAKALAAEEKFDFVIVGEPTKLKTVHTHKGAVWLTLRTSGLAVHASEPTRGENAIVKMARAIDAIERDVIPAFAKLNDPVLGSPTISVGTISGGSKVNIVPDHCEALVDCRSIPGQDIGQMLSLIRSRVPDIEIDMISSKPLFTDPANPVIECLSACGATPVGAPWFCDAAMFAAAGMPAVALGPGSIAQAHTADEWISIADLEAGTAFFKKFLGALPSLPKA